MSPNLTGRLKLGSSPQFVSATRDHAFLAEESGFSANWQSAEVLWVIDPLDGTTNFTHDIPIFSVSIAAMREGETLCGVVYQPMTQELFVAEEGRRFSSIIARLRFQRRRVSLEV